MNTYILEVVTRFNLQGIPKLPHVELEQVGTGSFFTVGHAEITPEYLGFTVASLEEAEQRGDIVTYYYQQKQDGGICIPPDHSVLSALWPK